MNLEIHFRGMDSSDGIKAHIEQKIEKLGRYMRDGEILKVILGKDGPQFYAELLLHDHARKKDVFAKQSGDNMYAQIDAAIDTLHAELKKHHDKQISAHQRAQKA